MTEALRASEEQYRTLAEAAHDMIFIINRDDRIEYVNSFGAQFLGQPAQKLAGKLRKLYFPAETSQHQGDAIQEVFQTGKAIAVESANIFLEQKFWLSTWLVPLKNDSGQVTSILGVSRDITIGNGLKKNCGKRGISLRNVWRNGLRHCWTARKKCVY